MVERNKESSVTFLKEKTLSHALIEELNPTTLINIDFYKSLGLWDEEISRKYEKVIKKWEHIKHLTQEETDESLHD